MAVRRGWTRGRTTERHKITREYVTKAGVESCHRRLKTMNAKWTARFINLASHVATWSKDPSSQVGAVIVRPDRSIASVGFNGFPRGVEDRVDRISDRSSKLLFTLHAEMNAILGAKEPLQGHSIFVYPFQPCAHCAAAIVQAGIKEVYCPEHSVPRWEESFAAARTMFHEAGIMVRWI